jgi:hypothetical protein
VCVGWDSTIGGPREKKNDGGSRVEGTQLDLLLAKVTITTRYLSTGKLVSMNQYFFVGF